jgi:hypothetical protein
MSMALPSRSSTWMLHAGRDYPHQPCRKRDTKGLAHETFSASAAWSNSCCSCPSGSFLVSSWSDITGNYVIAGRLNTISGKWSLEKLEGSTFNRTRSLPISSDGYVINHWTLGGRHFDPTTQQKGTKRVKMRYIS